MKKILAIAVIAAMVLTTAGAYAFGGWKGHEGKGDKEAYFQKMTEQLQLTPQQKTELEKQREEFGAKSKEIREKMGAARKALTEELDKPAPDMAQVEKIVAELKELSGRQIQSMIDKVLATKKVLTPEQYSKMKALREERKGKKGPMHGEKGVTDTPHGGA